MSAAAQLICDPEIKAEWEKESLNILKKLGYPIVEGATNPVALLPRVTSCLTRRILHLGEFIQDLEKAEKAARPTASKSRADEEKNSESILQKILGCLA